MGNEILMRTYNNTDNWKNWEKIYPDYTSINLKVNGYIKFNNKLILQWGQSNNFDTSIKNIL